MEKCCEFGHELVRSQLLHAKCEICGQRLDLAARLQAWLDEHAESGQPTREAREGYRRALVDMQTWFENVEREWGA